MIPITSAAASATPVGLRYQQIRSATDQLTEGLSDEDCVVQSMPDASPVKWHIAHTSWFFETFVLARHVPGYQPFHPAFRVLFNSYYNSVGNKHPRPQRGLITRPGLAEVRAYRRHVDGQMGLLLQGRGQSGADLMALVEMGLNHEQQHQELILTDLKHLLSRNPLSPAYRPTWPLMKIAARTPAWISHREGLLEIGHRDASFAFDNELPRHRVFVEHFELAAYPVSNGEYLQFIDDGGYRRPDLWLSMGWDAIASQGWQAPMYWEKIDDRWQVFTLHGRMPLDMNSPVCHLSYFEADAYARWAGARLPTEAEWEVAAATQPDDAMQDGNFADSGMLHPIPPRSERIDGGPRQVFGDVWEWTSSAYGPYPGFTPAPGAVGEYNGKFMCNQYVLRGGSCATPAGHVRASYRNFFPPDARWQFSGVRLARGPR